MSDEIIKCGMYWKLLNARIDEVPREGGETWIYHNPLSQAKRFISLAKSIFSHGYIADENSAIINKFENFMEPHVENGQKGIVNVSYENRIYSGLISVRKLSYNNDYSTWNGNHRLAILKCFYDKGLMNNKFIPVILDEEEKKIMRLLYKIKNKLYGLIKN